MGWHFLVVISGALPNLIAIKRHLSPRYLFFWCSFVIKASWLQRRSNEINILLYDSYYLQNCKSNTFEIKANHEKYKKPNIPSHLHIFWLNFDKAHYSFLDPSLMLRETDFRKNAFETIVSICLGFDGKSLGAISKWRRTWVKMSRINTFSGNVNPINLKILREK